MSTTVSKHQNFVGGEWVDATGGETMQSGYGKDLSAYSLEDYTQIKHVMAKID